MSERGVLPGVRYAVDAYVNFARQKPWIEAVASSLTELFGPAAIRVRLEALERHYPWIDPAGLEYFRTRLVQAPRDAQYALDLTVERCRTPEQQDAAVAALRFKTEMLWAQLDAIERGDTQPWGRRMTRPRLVTGARLRYDDVREEHVLLIPEGVVRLNPTAAEVLELCDGERSLDDIVGALSARYDGADVARRRSRAGRRDGAERARGRCRLGRPR